MASLHLLPNVVVMFLYFVLTSNSAVTQGYVDLGYAKHTVTTTRITARGHQIDIYKNIRYAKAPTGDLRFRYPQSPSLQAGIQNGTIGHDSTCISSVPAYAPYPPFNGTHFGSEDCLFLDVYVPKTVKPNDQIPVLHWLYGSAYAFGGKDFFSNPMGLFDELLSHHQPFVFVTSNYRMGLYGWASSPSEDMDSNIGLEDGRVALEWTQKYVHKFGGDPRDITAMGQSAGSGIIEMIIAESKYKTVPFQTAFLSSSDLPLKKDVMARRQEIYRTMLELANCTSLACLRNLPEAGLSDINNIMVSELPNNGGGGTLGPSMGFAPFVDGRTVHDLTPASLSEQHRDSKLKGLIVGNMQNEVPGTPSRALSTQSNFSDRPLPSPLIKACPKASPPWSTESFRSRQPRPSKPYNLFTCIRETYQRSLHGTGLVMLCSSVILWR
jgi:carboxylesterase type B